MSPPLSGETPRRRPPGMTDVARLAGVSQKTVSRVVNNERYVSDEVREKVLRAARELGFRPNTAARALITGRFRRIGVVSLGTALYGPASLQVALERATRAAGVSVTVANTAEGQPGAVAEAIEWLLQQGVDAVVISEPIDEGEPVDVDTDVPIYSLGQGQGLPEARNLLPGEFNRHASREAVEHLLDLGHARVRHLAGPGKWYAARERAQGWRDAHEARGIEPPPLLEGDWSPAAGYRAGLELLRDPDVTAVACANDDMAIGLVRAFAEAGRAVPEQVSVTGFDDIPAAAYLTPPLTTVRQQFEADAVRALGAVLRRLPGAPADAPEAEPRTDGRARSLVVRASTAPPPNRLKGEPGKDAR
ncbi:LacI family DNA-binding transcriptional regulator [Glycomyces sp. A-F 0318]|uniref:LacI family DNA-binding transcriptional regulator n=1 Tax=Glycomyces amatae TaxID=2881355 RepID=UPI001E493C64|nr:LacI family DNA-binding transcriptional regulator [Glycomyces amatae]MCD0446907.1 LacI family DNA-binding transcriptional regulator [Glycomyces amatae]